MEDKKIIEVNAYEIINPLVKDEDRKKFKDLEKLYNSISNEAVIILKSGNYYKYSTMTKSISQCPIPDSIYSTLPSIAYNKTHLFFIKSSGSTFSSAFPDAPLDYELMNLRKSTKYLDGGISKKLIHKISCGLNHTLFLTTTGIIYSFGKNDYGQLGLGDADKDLKELKAPKEITEVPENFQFTDISCGYNHSMAIGYNKQVIKNKNKVASLFTWGDNRLGQCCIKNEEFINTPTLFEQGIKQDIDNIACGANTCYALYSNNTVYAWGDNTYNQINLENQKFYNECQQIKFDVMAKKGAKIYELFVSANSFFVLTDKDFGICSGKIFNDGAKIIPLISYDDDVKVNLTDDKLIFFYFNKDEEEKVQICDEGKITTLQKVRKTEAKKEATKATTLKQPIKSSNNSNLNTKKVSGVEMSKAPPIKKVSESDNEIMESLSTTPQKNKKQFLINSKDFLTDDESYYSKHNRAATEANNAEDNTSSNGGIKNAFENIKGVFGKYKEKLPNMSMLPALPSLGNFNFPTLNINRYFKKIIGSNYNELDEESGTHNVNNSNTNSNNSSSNSGSNNNKIDAVQKHEPELKKIISTWNSKSTKKLFSPYCIFGYPPELRNKIWVLCAKNISSFTKDYYGILIDKVKTKKIDIPNLHDPFPVLNKFKRGSDNYYNLKEIISALLVSRPDIKYNNTLSYIAGFLLINMDKYKSFALLMNIILDPALIQLYLDNYGAVINRMQLFKQIFYLNLPDLCAHLELNEILPKDYFLLWHMALFSHYFENELVYRIWDIYLVHGIKAVFKIAISILKFYQDDLVNLDADGIMGVLVEGKGKSIDAGFVIGEYQNVKIPKWVEEEIDKMGEELIG